MQQKKYDFSFQDMADIWTKGQLIRFKKHLNIAKYKSKKFKCLANVKVYIEEKRRVVVTRHTGMNF